MFPQLSAPCTLCVLYFGCVGKLGLGGCIDHGIGLGIVGRDKKPPRTNNFNGDLICRAGRNRPQFEAVMESFLGQATSDLGTLR